MPPAHGNDARKRPSPGRSFCEERESDGRSCSGKSLRSERPPRPPLSSPQSSFCAHRPLALPSRRWRGGHPHLQGHKVLRQHFVEHVLGFLGRDHGKILHLLLLQMLLSQEQAEYPGTAGTKSEQERKINQRDLWERERVEKSSNPRFTSPPRWTPGWLSPETRGLCEDLQEVKVKG